MEFINSLASYFVLLLIFAALAGLGIFLGITLRKRSNAKAESTEQ